ncbi:unnamed protein product [Nesidiocoris tenuis]|uniref:Zinc finger CCCH domain-containing protein 14 n=1 Tax=Nesidiocoris tenuis TaxID=355587 RepID=A0A6H5HE26_9HEMI|nr:unnamed protein product [Nesidiocoris tenuis]
MELGIHIDNELPDYVMVLVANKKTQKQMEEDLSLFLGDCTVPFTSWLHNVLKKLEQVTVSTKAKKKDKSRRRGVDDSNGVSSTRRVKAEQIEGVKSEPQDEEKEDQPEEGSPTPETTGQTSSSMPPDEGSDNEDGMSLTDPSESRTDNNNEVESTSAAEDSAKDAGKPEDDKTSDNRPRERIKIVWDKERSPEAADSKDRERKRDRNQRVSKESLEKVKSQILKRTDRQRASRSSRSPSRSRRKLSKKTDRESVESATTSTNPRATFPSRSSTTGLSPQNQLQGRSFRFRILRLPVYTIRTVLSLTALTNTRKRTKSLA